MPPLASHWWAKVCRERWAWTLIPIDEPLRSTICGRRWDSARPSCQARALAACERVLAAMVQVAREDLSSRVSVPEMPDAVALLRDRDELLLLIDVVEREVRNSTAARARVVQEGQDRTIPSILESLTLARLEECRHFLCRSTRRGFSSTVGRTIRAIGDSVMNSSLRSQPKNEWRHP